jgi:glycosyltransferase involved in cell wall biosynthesis
MKVLIHSHSYKNCDGVSVRYKGHIKDLQSKNHEIFFMTGKKELDDNILCQNRYLTNEYRIPNTIIHFPIFSPQNLKIILNTINEFKPDIIHVTVDLSSLMWILAAKIMKVPIVVCYHSDTGVFMDKYNMSFFKKIVHRFERKFAEYSDNAFTVSDSYREKTLSMYGDILHEITWGPMININVFNNVSLEDNEYSLLREKYILGRDKLLIYAGRISTEKGLDYCIDFLKSTAITNLCFLIIGRGPENYSKKIQNYHNQTFSNQNTINYLPCFLSQEELSKMYKISDVYFSGSEFETLGFGAIESISCDCLALCPDSQGFKDTINHTINGYLYEPNNYDDTEKGLQLLLNKDSSNISKTCEEMNIDKCTTNALTIYTETIDNYEKKRNICEICQIITINLITSIFITFSYYSGLLYLSEY